MGAYQRLAKRLGHTRAFAAVMKRVMPHVDRFVSRLTGGRWTFVNTVLPTFILIHTGAKSGKEYRTPLSYIEIDARYGLAGTNFGQPHHPAWSANLIANPDARVVVDGRTISVRARRVTAEEKARLWPEFVKMWPPYDTYVTRSKRDIRVFVLEPR